MIPEKILAAYQTSRPDDLDVQEIQVKKYFTLLHCRHDLIHYLINEILLLPNVFGSNNFLEKEFGDLLGKDLSKYSPDIVSLQGDKLLIADVSCSWNKDYHYNEKSLKYSPIINSLRQNTDLLIPDFYLIWVDPTWSKLRSALEEFYSFLSTNSFAFNKAKDDLISTVQLVYEDIAEDVETLKRKVPSELLFDNIVDFPPSRKLDVEKLKKVSQKHYPSHDTITQTIEKSNLEEVENMFETLVKDQDIVNLLKDDMHDESMFDKAFTHLEELENAMEKGSVKPTFFIPFADYDENIEKSLKEIDIIVDGKNITRLLNPEQKSVMRLLTLLDSNQGFKPEPAGHLISKLKRELFTVLKSAGDLNVYNTGLITGTIEQESELNKQYFEYRKMKDTSVSKRTFFKNMLNGEVDMRDRLPYAYKNKCIKVSSQGLNNNEWILKSGTAYRRTHEVRRYKIKKTIAKEHEGDIQEFMNLLNEQDIRPYKTHPFLGTASGPDAPTIEKVKEGFLERQREFLSKVQNTRAHSFSKHSSNIVTQLLHFNELNTSPNTFCIVNGGRSNCIHIIRGGSVKRGEDVGQSFFTIFITDDIKWASSVYGEVSTTRIKIKKKAAYICVTPWVRLSSTKLSFMKDQYYSTLSTAYDSWTRVRNRNFSRQTMQMIYTFRMCVSLCPSQKVAELLMDTRYIVMASLSTYSNVFELIKDKFQPPYKNCMEKHIVSQLRRKCEQIVVHVRSNPPKPNKPGYSSNKRLQSTLGGTITMPSLWAEEIVTDMQGLFDELFVYVHTSKEPSSNYHEQVRAMNTILKFQKQFNNLEKSTQSGLMNTEQTRNWLLSGCQIGCHSKTVYWGGKLFGKRYEGMHKGTEFQDSCFREPLSELTFRMCVSLCPSQKVAELLMDTRYIVMASLSTYSNVFELIKDKFQPPYKNCMEKHIVSQLRRKCEQIVVHVRSNPPKPNKPGYSSNKRLQSTLGGTITMPSLWAEEIVTDMQGLFDELFVYVHTSKEPSSNYHEQVRAMNTILKFQKQFNNLGESTQSGLMDTEQTKKWLLSGCQIGCHSKTVYWGGKLFGKRYEGMYKGTEFQDSCFREPLSELESTKACIPEVSRTVTTAERNRADMDKVIANLGSLFRVNREQVKEPLKDYFKLDVDMSEDVEMVITKNLRVKVHDALLDWLKRTDGETNYTIDLALWNIHENDMRVIADTCIKAQYGAKREFYVINMGAKGMARVLENSYKCLAKHCKNEMISVPGDRKLEFIQSSVNEIVLSSERRQDKVFYTNGDCTKWSACETLASFISFNTGLKEVFGSEMVHFNNAVFSSWADKEIQIPQSILSNLKYMSDSTNYITETTTIKSTQNFLQGMFNYASSLKAVAATEFALHMFRKLNPNTFLACTHLEHSDDYSLVTRVRDEEVFESFRVYHKLAQKLFGINDSIKKTNVQKHIMEFISLFSFNGQLYYPNIKKTKEVGTNLPCTNFKNDVMSITSRVAEAVRLAIPLESAYFLQRVHCASLADSYSLTPGMRNSYGDTVECFSTPLELFGFPDCLPIVYFCAKGDSEPYRLYNFAKDSVKKLYEKLFVLGLLKHENEDLPFFKYDEDLGEFYAPSFSYPVRHNRLKRIKQKLGISPEESRMYFDANLTDTLVKPVEKNRFQKWLESMYFNKSFSQAYTSVSRATMTLRHSMFSSKPCILPYSAQIKDLDLHEEHLDFWTMLQFTNQIRTENEILKGFKNVSKKKAFKQSICSYGTTLRPSFSYPVRHNRLKRIKQKLGISPEESRMYFDANLTDTLVKPVEKNRFQKWLESMYFNKSFSQAYTSVSRATMTLRHSMFSSKPCILPYSAQIKDLDLHEEHLDFWTMLQFTNQIRTENEILENFKNVGKKKAFKQSICSYGTTLSVLYEMFQTIRIIQDSASETHTTVQKGPSPYQSVSLENKVQTLLQFLINPKNFYDDRRRFLSETSMYRDLETLRGEFNLKLIKEDMVYARQVMKEIMSQSPMKSYGLVYESSDPSLIGYTLQYLKYGLFSGETYRVLPCKKTTLPNSGTGRLMFTKDWKTNSDSFTETLYQIALIYRAIKLRSSEPLTVLQELLNYEVPELGVTVKGFLEEMTLSRLISYRIGENAQKILAFLKLALLGEGKEMRNYLTGKFYYEVNYLPSHTCPYPFNERCAIKFQNKICHAYRKKNNTGADVVIIEMGNANRVMWFYMYTIAERVFGLINQVTFDLRMTHTYDMHIKPLKLSDRGLLKDLTNIRLEPQYFKMVGKVIQDAASVEDANLPIICQKVNFTHGKFGKREEMNTISLFNIEGLSVYMGNTLMYTLPFGNLYCKNVLEVKEDDKSIKIDNVPLSWIQEGSKLLDYLKSDFTGFSDMHEVKHRLPKLWKTLEKTKRVKYNLSQVDSIFQLDIRKSPYADWTPKGPDKEKLKLFETAHEPVEDVVLDFDVSPGFNFTSQVGTFQEPANAMEEANDGIVNIGESSFDDLRQRSMQPTIPEEISIGTQAESKEELLSLFNSPSMPKTDQGRPINTSPPDFGSLTSPELVDNDAPMSSNFEAGEFSIGKQCESKEELFGLFSAPIPTKPDKKQPAIPDLPPNDFGLTVDSDIWNDHEHRND
uniref:RNA-directed RNA polymerase L n=1 Tax=Halophytophthora RNA virus 8 TaxID=2717550 RepID=A0A7D5FTQ3_9VIRU|nr:RNA-dependent RNA polymerase [Halophytophthora RNA virus 8]